MPPCGVFAIHGPAPCYGVDNLGLELHSREHLVCFKELSKGGRRQVALEVRQPFVIAKRLLHGEVAHGAELEQVRCAGRKALAIQPGILPETGLPSIAHVELGSGMKQVSGSLIRGQWQIKPGFI